MSTKNTKLAEVYHYDLHGKREEKYDFLNQNSMASINWTELTPKEYNFFFTNKNFEGSGEYEKGFKVDDLFLVNTSGIKTHSDKELVSFEKFKEYNQKYHYRVFDDRFIC